MKAFRRLFNYILPQWLSLITIFVCVIFIGVLFSASFITVIPLLKVMMGQEGIHGWVNREMCKQRYGMDFYVPDRVELADPTQNVAYYLNIVYVEKGNAAFDAGLQVNDRILSVYADSEPRTEQTSSSSMLREISHRQAGDDMLLSVARLDAFGNRQMLEINLEAVAKPFYSGAVEKIMSYVSIDEDKQSKKEAVQIILILMIIATAIRCFARFWQDFLSIKVVNIAVNHIRRDMFAHMVNMPIKYFDAERPSDSVSRIIKDTEGTGHGIKVLLGKAIREPSKAIFTLVFAFLINWQIVLIFMCGAPFVGITISKFGKKIKKSTRHSLVSWSQMLGKLEETISGLRAVKVYNRQKTESSEYAQINDNLLRHQNKIAKVDSATGPILEVLGMLAGSAGLLFALNWVFTGELDEAQFFTLLILLGSSAESFRKSSNVWNTMQHSAAAAERIFNLLDQEIEKEPDKPAEIGEIENSIEFKDVVFSYPSSSEPVLNGVNISVKAGCNIAIVGPNGSGKTTLLNLLPRFYDADSGKIMIDGINVRDISLKSLRDKIAVVSQKIITFNTTIAQNIAYGKSDATIDEVISAAKHSYAHEFIVNLPAGYDTVIGEDGVGLSGGQLQRIVIARAILKNPQILIFDEAMSQVDADSEAKIAKALSEITTNRTSFVIAHRFSTVVNSDVIAVMNDGKIIATGKHSELSGDEQRTEHAVQV